MSMGVVMMVMMGHEYEYGWRVYGRMGCTPDHAVCGDGSDTIKEVSIRAAVGPEVRA